jgi:hypothetical protein
MDDDTGTLHDLNHFRSTRGTDPTLVPCAKCNTLINMNVVRCPNCGIHFNGPAFQFSPKWERHRQALPLWMRVIMYAIGIALLAGVLVMFILA